MTAPKPTARLRSCLASFGDEQDPLTLLTLCDDTRKGLRAYEDQLAAAARKQGATWDQIGRALGIPRQNAFRRFGRA